MTTFAEIKRIAKELAKNISEFTGVEERVVANVIRYSKSLTRADNPGVIDELVFVAQMGHRFGITSRFHLQLMFEAVRLKSAKCVTMEQFARLVCVFMSPILDRKIDYVFTVYDFKKDDQLELSEITTLLKTTIIHAGEDNDPQEILNDLISLVLSVTDTDGDNHISLDEFRVFVKHDILCLQLLGNCLPTEAALRDFHHLMKYSSAHQITEYFQQERARCLQEPIVRKTENKYYPGISMDLA